MPRKKKKKPMVLALRELARVVVLSVIPVILLGIDGVEGGIAVNWDLVIAVGLIAGLRFVDKYLHKTSEEEKWLGKKGLTGF